MRILNPERPPVAAPSDAPDPHAGTLSGKTLAIVSNPWRSFRIWQEEFAALAVNKYEAKAVLKPRNPEDAAKAPDYCIDEALEADLVIDGLGFWGGCTSWSVRDSIKINNTGIPTVVGVGSHFESLARAVIKSQGLPDFPMVIVPEDLEDRTDDELRKMAPEYFEMFLEKLGILVHPD